MSALVMNYQRGQLLLATPVHLLKGVGPRLQSRFISMGIRTVEDLLFTLPHRYEDRRRLKSIRELTGIGVEIFAGEIVLAGEVELPRSRKRLYEVVVRDGSGSITLKWFHYKRPMMEQIYRVGRMLVVIGEVKQFTAQREVHHPEVEFFEGDPREVFMRESSQFGCILPVYPLTEGLNQKTARKIWRQAVEQFCDAAVSVIPDAFLGTHGNLPLPDALRNAHLPSNEADIDQLNRPGNPNRQRLVYEEFFLLQTGMAMKRQGAALEPGIAFAVTHKYTKPLAELLPYRLTDAQRRVLAEIKNDMAAPVPMSRLVQGDVGCGKTVVALMAALMAIENGYQVAVVAPTEILAEQHYLQFAHWFDQLGLSLVRLTGSLAAAERREAYARIASGDVPLVVGTHAILQEGVEFARLGLGIIDEQHRFGVRQRAMLRRKGENPDMLVMTATPIPRTLSLTLYGDLALSVIDELPPGRTPIKTKVLSEVERRKAYNFFVKELQNGHQVYVVYPLVEESEKVDMADATAGAERLQQLFPDHRIGLLHGKMKSDEKEQVMLAFKEREIDILVATTVIEVGIDVPNATLMMIEHADRFGLAQLHQLRGRVGRGGEAGYCILMQSERCGEEGQKRLMVMEESSDGFAIAEADLAIRGPGEFLGTRQSGLPEFRVANLVQDAAVLEEARRQAFAFVDTHDLLHDPALNDLRRALMHRWGSRLELATVG